MRVAGWLLIAGGTIALMGAGTPPYKQWYSPLPEALRVIAANPIGWRFIHAGFFVGTVLAAFGLAVFAMQRAGQSDSWLATISAVAFALATAFWTVNIIYRLSITPWAANEFVSTGTIPPMYAPLERQSALTFAAWATMAAIALVSMGASVLKSGVAPRWVGWTSLAVGIVGAPMVSAIGPWMLYVPLIMLGVSLVRG